jgi:hypothetical protein
MQGQNLVNYVIRKRGSFQSRDKIAQVLARSGALDYYQAQRLVLQVERKYARRIALRQLPWTLAIGIPGLIAGLFLAITMVISVSYGRFRPGTIYYGLFGVGLFLGSAWGLLSITLKIVRG